jgi:hypothetical protein
VPWSGAPDCPVCHRTVSNAPGSYRCKLFSFGFLRRRSAIIHRTVRCATGLSGAPAEQWIASATIGCNSRLQRYSARTVRAEVRAATRGAPDSERYLSGVALDCPVLPEDKAPNGQNRQNPNGWVTWLAHRTMSCGAPDCPVAHRTVRCAHRQQSPQQLNWWLGAINTPQPPPLQPSKHSSLIQYKSKVQHSKTQIKASNPIKVLNLILVL